MLFSWYIAPKLLLRFSFFQLSWVPNINLYVKSIETLARAFLTLNILSIGAVEAVDALLPEVEKKLSDF